MRPPAVGCLDELIAHRTPLVGVLGVPDLPRPKPVQGEGEGGWVTQPAGHGQGLLAGSEVTRSGVLRSRSAPASLDEQLDAKDAVLRREDGEGVLEQWDELVVLAGAHPDEASAEYPMAARASRSELPSRVATTATAANVSLAITISPLPGLSFSQCQQDLAPSGFVRLRLGVERRP